MGAVPVLSLRALASDECDAHVAKCPRVSKDAATASSSSFLEALRHHRYCVISCDIDADEGNGTSLPLANAIAQSYEAGCTFFGLAPSVREEYTELKAQQRDFYGCGAHSVRSSPATTRQARPAGRATRRWMKSRLMSKGNGRRDQNSCRHPRATAAGRTLGQTTKCECMKSVQLQHTP